jgi:hypothetical protein
MDSKPRSWRPKSTTLQRMRATYWASSSGAYPVAVETSGSPELGLELGCVVVLRFAWLIERLDDINVLKVPDQLLFSFVTGIERHAFDVLSETQPLLDFRPKKWRGTPWKRTTKDDLVWLIKRLENPKWQAGDECVQYGISGRSRKLIKAASRELHSSSGHRVPMLFTSAIDGPPKFQRLGWWASAKFALEWPILTKDGEIVPLVNVPQASELGVFVDYIWFVFSQISDGALTWLSVATDRTPGVEQGAIASGHVSGIGWELVTGIGEKFGLPRITRDRLTNTQLRLSAELSRPD